MVLTFRGDRKVALALSGTLETQDVRDKEMERRSQTESKCRSEVLPVVLTCSGPFFLEQS